MGGEKELTSLCHLSNPEPSEYRVLTVLACYLPRGKAKGGKLICSVMHNEATAHLRQSHSIMLLLSKCNAAFAGQRQPSCTTLRSSETQSLWSYVQVSNLSHEKTIQKAIKAFWKSKSISSLIKGR